ncbi:hypothetical protein MuYL_0489 [Mucilaginibacter xinganensis]|uniref:Uncharacterized protein n=1 Tax=Mucilaginibacter xinganensis TaxID=1234841 RepID=A0A223NR57_9SPHI|nr:hypothetical protein MuYL_0489 [Mucilaginibacter xinganensis]
MSVTLVYNEVKCKQINVNLTAIVFYLSVMKQVFYREGGETELIVLPVLVVGCQSRFFGKLPGFA